MSSRHLVDPELAPLLDAFPTVTLSAETLPAMRARQLPLTASDETDVELEERSIDGPVGPLALRIYRPRGADGALGGILHLHGGGFVGGSSAAMEAIHRPLVAALGCVLVAVDYRLAPETTFPGNLDDCYAALAWMMGEADALGIDPDRLGVMGESAGGGLAAALALLARDRGEYRLAFQHLIYPMLDDRTCVRDPHPHAGEFIWHRANNHFGWSSLLGHEPGGANVSPFAAPARATDLAGLPPTFIGTAALDLFVDEDIDFAARLIRAGVPTELHVWPGAFHGFDLMPGARVADAARAASLAALRRFLESGA